MKLLGLSGVPAGEGQLVVQSHVGLAVVWWHRPGVTAPRFQSLPPPSRVGPRGQLQPQRGVAEEGPGGGQARCGKHVHQGTAQQAPPPPPPPSTTHHRRSRVCHHRLPNSSNRTLDNDDNDGRESLLWVGRGGSRSGGCAGGGSGGPVDRDLSYPAGLTPA